MTGATVLKASSTTPLPPSSRPNQTSDHPQRGSHNFPNNCSTNGNSTVSTPDLESLNSSKSGEEEKSDSHILVQHTKHGAHATNNSSSSLTKKEETSSSRLPPSQDSKRSNKNITIDKRAQNQQNGAGSESSRQQSSSSIVSDITFDEGNSPQVSREQLLDKKAKRSDVKHSPPRRKHQHHQGESEGGGHRRKRSGESGDGTREATMPTSSSATPSTESSPRSTVIDWNLKGGEGERERRGVGAGERERSGGGGGITSSRVAPAPVGDGRINGAPAAAGAVGGSRSSRRLHREQRRARSEGVAEMRMGRDSAEAEAAAAEGALSHGIQAGTLHTSTHDGRIYPLYRSSSSARGHHHSRHHQHHRKLTHGRHRGTSAVVPEPTLSPEAAKQIYLYQQQYPQAQAVGMSAAGNPLIPILSEAGGGVGGASPAPAYTSERKRKQYPPGSRPRSSSTSLISGAHAMYGTTPAVPPPPPPPPIMRAPPQAPPPSAYTTQIPPSPGGKQAVAGFSSAMGELRHSLTGGTGVAGGGAGAGKAFQPQRSRMGRHQRSLSDTGGTFGGSSADPRYSPRSPTSSYAVVGGGALPMTPPVTPRASSLRNIRYDPNSENSPPPSDMRVHFSPTTPLSSRGVVVYSVPEDDDIIDDGGIVGSVDGEGRPLLLGEFSPSSPYFDDNDDDDDGNSDFLPQGPIGQHHKSHLSRRGTGGRSVESMRKMHMRQQSAQLFMDEVRGKEQPTACRDVLFALLFTVHLAAMVYVGMMYGPSAIAASSKNSSVGVSNGNHAYSGSGVHLGGEEPVHVVDNGDEGRGGGKNPIHDVTISYVNVIEVALLCGAFAAGVSALTLFVMTVIARRIVQVALVFSIGLSFAWGTIGIGVDSKSFVPVTGIIALALSVGYTFVVWDRIPFAASNLAAALSSVRAKWGTVLVAFLYQFLALVWTIYYTFVLIGVYNAIKGGQLQLSSKVTGLVYAVLAVSYYWTFQVLMHSAQVTVAGTVGDWWYKPTQESSCCDKSVVKSFIRATVFSFGSICFGSLLVGPVQLLRQVAEYFRPNREESVLMCLHECLVCFQECIVGCVDGLADNFNPWAFTYVGLYGYNFFDAGHNATVLFHKRGWSRIVVDDLIPNVLFMVSLVIGGVTGCFGLLIEAIDRFGFTSVSEPGMTAFVIGLIVGLVLSSVLLSIISSAVNAVIVCFAGSPVEFETNHPELSHEMRSAWREVWPGCMDVVDLKIALGVGSKT